MLRPPGQYTLISPSPAIELIIKKLWGAAVDIVNPDRIDFNVEEIIVVGLGER
jgi:hypothetical protein